MATKYVKFLRGTPQAYEKLAIKDNDTLYFIYEEDEASAELYLGSKLIAGSKDGPISTASYLSALQDVLISENLLDSSFLVYDAHSHKWINKALDQLFFVGATDLSSGIGGLVPAPEVGQTDLFLKSDGTWAAPEVNHLILTLENPTRIAHETIIADATEGLINSIGDIIIIKDLVYNNKWQYTAYVYDDEWQAMDGNYDANNVYFSSDFLFTKPVGVIEIPESGSKEVVAAGKNLTEFLTSIFTQELDPTSEKPKIQFTTINSGMYEVGTELIPSYALSFNEGNYSYDESTGVEITKYIVTDSNNIELNTASGTFAPLLITDTTNYTITAYATYDEGNIPSTNLGNPCKDESIKIAAGNTRSITATYSGYRPYYYGMTTSTGDITASTITALTKGGNYNSSKTLTFDASTVENVKRFIVAIPSTSNRNGVINATIISSMNADALNDYILYENLVTLSAGGNEVAYDVWVYQPASIASVEKHEVILA